MEGGTEENNLFLLGHKLLILIHVNILKVPKLFMLGIRNEVNVKNVNFKSSFYRKLLGSN
jgi:hypothetical protein